MFAFGSSLPSPCREYVSTISGGVNRALRDSCAECVANVVQVHHRLFTCDTLKDTHPTGILSQSDIVKLMWHHKVELVSLLSKSVEELGLCAVCPFFL